MRYFADRKTVTLTFDGKVLNKDFVQFALELCEDNTQLL